MARPGKSRQDAQNLQREFLRLAAGKNGASNALQSRFYFLQGKECRAGGNGFRRRLNRYLLAGSSFVRATGGSRWVPGAALTERDNRSNK